MLHNLRAAVTASPLRAAVQTLEVLIVLALAWACAQLVWAFVTPLTAPSSAVPGAVSPTSQSSGTDVSRLRGFPYFYPIGAQERRVVPNTFEAQPTETRAARPAAPETELDLKLFGLRAEVGAGDRGSAIIQTTDNRQAAFVPGQMIQQGVQLEQVFPDRVEITRDGVRESLYLNPERRPLPFDRALDGAPPMAPVGNGFEPAPVAATPSPGGQRRVSRSELQGVSPAEALAQFQLRPRLEGSRINGFVVQALGADPRLRMLDVQPGDVIMDVNGMRLTSFERVSELPEELRGATELRIGLIRDGQREERRIEIAP